ncbi:MAG: LLM class flavin-dependent oxidoreductase [Kineosporiaceae bacterium]
MRLALSLGSWSAGHGQQDLRLAIEADRLGCSAVWVAEAYGSDAVTVLAWLAARTERIALGAGVLQVPARSPAMTAMTASTLDLLSGGRFRLGLGVSGPQVSEGWHGVPFAAPMSRLREYTDAVRLALSRRPLDYQGRHVQVPPPGSTARAIRLSQRPVRPTIPLYLAALGPRALELCGEIADGWLAVFTDTGTVRESMSRIAEGRRARPADASDEPRPEFDAVVTCSLVVTDVPGAELDLDTARDLARPYAALYVGGMGGPQDNVYAALAARLGYETEARTVQRLYLSGDRQAAAAALPGEFLDGVSLIGTAEQIAARLAEYSAAGATTVAVMPFAPDPEQRAGMLDATLRALGSAA